MENQHEELWCCSCCPGQRGMHAPKDMKLATFPRENMVTPICHSRSLLRVKAGHDTVAVESVAYGAVHAAMSGLSDACRRLQETAAHQHYAASKRRHQLLLQCCCCGWYKA
jgi:hypothetical protein